MKKQILTMFVLIFASVSLVMIGCASSSGPQLGTPTLLQEVLNAMSPISVSGKNLKFEFGGDAWIARVDGKNFSAGTFKSEETATGSIITLQQTHIYSTTQNPGIGGDIGWIPTPTTDIVLEYKKGPPESFGLKK